MTPEQIQEVTCNCAKGKNPNANKLYRDEDSNHWLCENCKKPIEAIARFVCASCGEFAINPVWYEFNLNNDYNEKGELITHLECWECE